MKYSTDISDIIDELKHYLPSQNPLKDFVHHNTLHAFQSQKFHNGLSIASQTFGYKTYLPIQEYRTLWKNGEIDNEILDSIIQKLKGKQNLEVWRQKLLTKEFDEWLPSKIGKLKAIWALKYKINTDKSVYPILFRTISNFIDQGIGMYKFPYHELNFLDAIRNLEKNSTISFFKTSRAKTLLLAERDVLSELLELIVGDSQYFQHYLFDQQFAHPGWSGMVATIEDNPNSIIDKRKVSLREFIIFELLLELDTLDSKYGEIWKPISMSVPNDFEPYIFEKDTSKELFEVYKIWQEAYEWSYFDKVLFGLQKVSAHTTPSQKSFQAIFCIDDRECSIRRYIEMNDDNCETYGTAGFFNIPIFFKPTSSKFSIKVCPAPIHPKHVVIENCKIQKQKSDIHFSKKTQGIIGGLISAPTMGFWSALQMGLSILKPRPTNAMVSSFNHLKKNSTLSIDFNGYDENGLQIGFTIEEMAVMMESLLKSIGLKDFADIVYIIGHGASSTNNTHYAGYDCGACSGKAGSANARIAAYMCNKPEVRKLLLEKGISIPENTIFMSGIHDTTRDEILFFDEETLSQNQKNKHTQFKNIFNKSLRQNAVERSRRFLNININQSHQKIHKEVIKRSESLFETRPEWNHASNALCFIGLRNSVRNLYLDRRSFLNSYDYRLDTDGKLLLNILNAVVPVCGGINLEYYFSKVDNNRLGAGSKLSHNVMGLVGVSNGVEGDLRTGLPSQMLNIHSSLRLMFIIEQKPEIVSSILRINSKTFEWISNEWVILAVIDPETKELFIFVDNNLVPYNPINQHLNKVDNLTEYILGSSENIPVCELI